MLTYQRALVLVLGLTSIWFANAVDGVIEINQARALAGSGSTVTGNVANRNNGNGISIIFGGTVIGNAVSGNDGLGLRMDSSRIGYEDNVLTSNNGGEANPQVSGGTQIGTNLCGTNTPCP